MCVEKGEAIDYFAPDELAEARAAWFILRREELTIPRAQNTTARRHSVEQLVGRAAEWSRP